ncbi:MAG: hypothetical protein WAL75_06785 [Terracidiphilus sp.]
MIDISEIWDNIELIAALVVIPALIVASFRIRKRWLRNAALGISSFLFLVVGGLTFIVGCYMVTSNARVPPIVSPDRKHVAVVRWWLPGALGDDEVHVSIRHAYSPVAVEIENGAAEPPDPKVEWLDNNRLLITYWEKGQVRPCSTKRGKVEGIEVLCRD